MAGKDPFKGGFLILSRCHRRDVAAPSHDDMG